MRGGGLSLSIYRGYMKKKKLYYEKVKVRRGNQVIISDIFVATRAQIQETKQLHKSGKCPHTIVYDDDGFLYDFRICGTCGKFLGYI